MWALWLLLAKLSNPPGASTLRASCNGKCAGREGRFYKFVREKK